MGLLTNLLKKKMQRAINDEVLEVGNAHMIFNLAGSPIEHQSAVGLVIGRSKVAFQLLDMRSAPINMVTLLRNDFLRCEESGTGEIIITTNKGGRYVLTAIRPYDQIARLLVPPDRRQ